MAEKTFIIRDYKSENYDSVIELWGKTGLGGVERGDNKNVIELSLDMGGKLLMMEDLETGEFIGTSWMTFDGRRLHLHHFGIDPQYQGRKFAKPLLKKSLSFAREKNVQIKLEVHKDNYKALGLYKKNHFKYLGDYRIFIIRDIGKIEL